MNRDREDRPYRFFAPRYSRTWAAIFTRSAAWVMRRHFRIESLTQAGGEHVAELHRKGHALLLAPNHADHADPSVLLTTARRLGLQFHFMAARECFERGRLSAFVLQRMGCFSVDREGADVSAIKAALACVRDGRWPLVLFPEGEIWHHHERLDDLNDGVAAIALRAASGLPESRRCYIVPVVLRYRHDPAVAATFGDRLARLEQRVWWKPRPDLPVVDRIRRLGSGLVAIKEQEHLGRNLPGDLPTRIAGLQAELVQRVEQRMGETAGKNMATRIRHLRKRIRQRLRDPAQADGGPDRAALYELLDVLFLAVQLYSYPVPYIGVKPTVDRVAETLFKLEEDVLGGGVYPAARQAAVNFGTPIEVAEFATGHGGPKAAVEPLIRAIADVIQRGLDQSSSEGDRSAVSTFNN